MKTGSITNPLASFVAYSDVSVASGAMAIARLSMIDWLTVAIAGLREPVATIVRELVVEEGGTPQSTAFGMQMNVPARAAALNNGTLSHSLDFDDTHFSYIGHPSVVVFSAALAIAERVDASEAAFVEAALIGMETACRIGHWFGGSHYNAGFHQTSTSGTFGATAACARLLKLNHAQTKHALGIAATRASGLRSQFGTMGKPLNAGFAASNGVEAALLAAKGLISRPDGIECSQGFSETHAGQGGDPTMALSGLGRDYWFENVQHKLFACCHGTHAAIEGLMRYRSTAAFGKAVSRVVLTVNPVWLDVCNIPVPKTGLESKFSYRTIAAMVLLGQNLSNPRTFSTENCLLQDIVNLRNVVEVYGNPGITDLMTHVRIDDADGAAWETSVDLTDVAPIDVRRARVREKAISLLGPGHAALIDSLAQCSTARLIAKKIAATCTMRMGDG